MDRVRFGRALGMGAREAARALASAADAALAPDPRSPAVNPPKVQRSASTQPSDQQREPTRGNLREGGRRFGQGVVKPLAKASSVLWYEFTGTFFGIFALTMALETWKERASLRPGVFFNGYAWLAPMLLLVFGYFTVSSFVSASRRGRR